MSVWVGSGGAGVELHAPPVTTAAAFMSTNTSMESGIEAGVLPTVTGSLASARDSLGSLSRAAEPMYDTDHTDLGSELDEAEIRRELMHDKWRILFDRFDPEGFGEIPWPDFLQTLKHPDFIAHIPPHKLEILLDKAQCATSNAITFQEFVNVSIAEPAMRNALWVITTGLLIALVSSFHILDKFVARWRLKSLMSDRMDFCDLYLQPEAAFNILAHLGELGCVQFIDMTPDLNAFQRNYIAEVRRFIELERKLRYMRTEMKKYDVFVPELAKEPAAMSPHDLNTYETLLEKSENDIAEMEANQVKLMQNYQELTEIHYVLSTIEPILGNVELRGDAIFSNKPQAAGDVLFGGGLSVITGVVPRSKCYSLEMMLWRISRGNIYFRAVNEDKLFTDPSTGTSIRKVAFIAVSQGEALSARMDKVCSGFRASIYPCPKTARERTEMIRKLNTIIQDLGQVLKKTRYHRCKALRAIGKQWPTWSVQVKKAKAVYHTMNLLSLDFTRKCLIGQCWVSSRDLPKVQEILRQYSAVGANVQSFLSKRTTSEIPPTYHRTNKFTYGFQMLIMAYGDSSYREINPGLFTIITFPFLFAVMFGDLGHGLVMFSFAVWMLIKEKKFMEERSTNEIWNIFFGGRYIILLMSIFTLFTGFVYNDIFSKAMVFRNSYWKNQFRFGEMRSSEYLTLDPMGDVNTPYPFGIDPAWTLSTNKIMYDNSIKMKMSIILGVTQMLFGLFISLFNHIYFRRYYAIILEFIPQVLFLTCLFVWLVVMIFWKWLMYGAKKQEVKLQPGCAPLILILFIDMALMRTTKNPDPNCEPYMFDYQQLIQKCLLFTGLASVPVLLFGTPIYKLRKAKKARTVKTAAVLARENSRIVGIEASEESFGELMIHQGVHTIEYVLSTISHTASYLRLWALSLAHAQLSEMLWDMVLSKIGLQNRGDSGFAMLFVIFAVWAAFTLAILVIMEGLSAFLHTLRLHWVEFMSKFYMGGGYMFTPFSFKDVLYGEEDKKTD